jgi:phenylalanyl-tRNA synthetase beta subunit
MAKFDTVSESSWVLLGKLTASGTSTVVTSLVDMQGFNALDVAFVNATVTDAGAAGGYTIKLQEADVTTTGSFTDVATTDGVGGTVTTSTTVDTDDDKLTAVLGYIGGKRYVRASLTGTTLSDAVVYVLARRSRSGLSRPNTIVGAATAAT